MSLARRLVLVAAAAAVVVPVNAASAACHPQATACVDHDVASVSVVVRGTSVEVHRGGWSLTDQYVFCAPEFVMYLRHPERDYEAYAACAFNPDRVL